MDFPAFVAGHPDRAILLAWWQELVSPAGCPHLAANIRGDDVFFADTYAANRHLTEFAKALPPPSGAPKRAALAAIEAGRWLVCVGPRAALDEPLCRIHLVITLVKHNLSPRGLLSQNPDDVAQALTDDATFQSYLDPSRPLRGVVPVVFWAAEADVMGFCGATGNCPAALRQFLGLELNPARRPVVLLRLSDPGEPTRVPTGFDAFDHEFFRPLTVTPGQPLPSHGETRNLYAPGQPGAREVVTAQLHPGQFRFIMTLT